MSECQKNLLLKKFSPTAVPMQLVPIVVRLNEQNFGENIDAKSVYMRINKNNNRKFYLMLTKFSPTYEPMQLVPVVEKLLVHNNEISSRVSTKSNKQDNSTQKNISDYTKHVVPKILFPHTSATRHRTSPKMLSKAVSPPNCNQISNLDLSIFSPTCSNFSLSITEGCYVVDPEREKVPSNLDSSVASNFVVSATPDSSITNSSTSSCKESSKVSLSSSTVLQKIDFSISSKDQSNRNGTNSLLTDSFTNTLNSTENADFSISNLNTGSEYFPDTTLDTCENRTSLTIASVELESSITELIKHPLKLTSVKVPHRYNQTKKHFCVYCKTLQTTLSRHFYLKHKSEDKIKEALNYPSKSKKRAQIITELRKQGDFLHNTSEQYNTGILIVSRQQQRKSQNNADDYVCCKTCQAFFSKKSLRKHIRNCSNKNKNSRDNFKSSRKLTQYIHPSANSVMRTKIFPVFRNDEVTRAIRYDELIIKYGNKLSEKYTLTHQHDMIRSRLRLLGRFLIEVKVLYPGIDELKEIFKPDLFDICVDALRKASNWDENLMWFKTPAVAQHLVSLVKKVGSKQRSEFIKSRSEQCSKDLENFLLLWEEEMPVLINKKALEDQSNQKRAKKVLLPTKSDIKKLYSYLKNKIFDAIFALQNNFDRSLWEELVKSTLIFIQIFNRRRAGEIERLTINSYINKEIVTDKIEKEQLNKMSEESISFAKQYARLTIRGKLGRNVPVLLSPLSTKAIDLILKYRTIAGIPESNEYIFSKCVTSKFSKQYFRACPLLKLYAEQCGAEKPQTLTGTTLRKQIATYTSLLNVEDATVDKLANFMGHHKDIHKSVYRVSVPVSEVTCVTKLLMLSMGDENTRIEDDENDRESEVELLCTQNETESDKDPNSSSTSKRKKRSTSPYGKTKRNKWSEEEKHAIYSIFGELKKLEKLPSVLECFNAIKGNAALKNRTPHQIKSWIDNQRRYK